MARRHWVETPRAQAPRRFVSGLLALQIAVVAVAVPLALHRRTLLGSAFDTDAHGDARVTYRLEPPGGIPADHLMWLALPVAVYGAMGVTFAHPGRYRVTGFRVTYRDAAGRHGSQIFPVDYRLLIGPPDS